MTYFSEPPKFNYNLAFYTQPTTVTLTNNYTVLPQTQVTVVGSPSATLNTSNGIITLPDKPCLLSGCLQYYVSTSTVSYIDFQWYDVTNSQYIGNIARLKGSHIYKYYESETLTTDEEANAIAQNIQVKMVVKTTSNSSAVLEDTSSSYVAYAGRSRLAIYEF